MPDDQNKDMGLTETQDTSLETSHDRLRRMLAASFEAQGSTRRPPIKPCWSWRN